MTTPGDAEAIRWLVLDIDGRSVGKLELPAKLSVLWSHGDTFGASETAIRGT